VGGVLLYGASRAVGQLMELGGSNNRSRLLEQRLGLTRQYGSTTLRSFLLKHYGHQQGGTWAGTAAQGHRAVRRISQHPKTSFNVSTPGDPGWSAGWLGEPGVAT